MALSQVNDHGRMHACKQVGSADWRSVGVLGGSQRLAQPTYKSLLVVEARFGAAGQSHQSLSVSV